MSEHTKGEWKEWFSDVITYDRHGNPVTIADCAEGNLLSNEEREANARLVAAAPDLLQSCIEMLENFGDHIGEDEYNAITARAEKAISKARGKE